MSDGRLPRTALYDRIRAVTGVEEDLDLVDVVLTRWDRSRGRIAALAPTVTAAAADGDPAAGEILQQAVAQLAELVDATRRGLGFQPGEDVAVSYSGGVFKSEAIRAGFTAALLERSPDFDLRTPRFPPHLGAALYAAKLSGEPLGESALAHLAGERPAAEEKETAGARGD
jgi:N-acetylglucosamine kinase-like BadF-type ATPase